MAMTFEYYVKTINTIDRFFIPYPIEPSSVKIKKEMFFSMSDNVPIKSKFMDALCFNHPMSFSGAEKIKEVVEEW